MYQFNFSAEEVNLIVNALGELPAKLSRNLLNKIELTIQKQEQDFSESKENGKHEKHLQ